MLKIYAMQATKNVAVAFNGNLRENFEKGDKIITTRDEYRILLRLGFELIEEKYIGFDDIFQKSLAHEKTEKDENFHKDSIATDGNARSEGAKQKSSKKIKGENENPENPEPPKDGE